MLDKISSDFFRYCFNRLAILTHNLCNFFRLLGSGPAAGQTPDFADDVINRTCICWQGEKRE